MNEQEFATIIERQKTIAGDVEQIRMALKEHIKDDHDALKGIQDNLNDFKVEVATNTGKIEGVAKTLKYTIPTITAIVTVLLEILMRKL